MSSVGAGGRGGRFCVLGGVTFNPPPPPPAISNGVSAWVSLSGRRTAEAGEPGSRFAPPAALETILELHDVLVL